MKLILEWLKMNNHLPKPQKSLQGVWNRNRVKTKHRRKIITWNHFIWTLIVFGISIAASQYLQIQGIHSILTVATILILCLMVAYLRFTSLRNVTEYMEIDSRSSKRY